MSWFIIVWDTSFIATRWVKCFFWLLQLATDIIEQKARFTLFSYSRKLFLNYYLLRLLIFLTGISIPNPSCMLMKLNSSCLYFMRTNAIDYKDWDAYSKPVLNFKLVQNHYWGKFFMPYYHLILSIFPVLECICTQVRNWWKVLANSAQFNNFFLSADAHNCNWNIRPQEASSSIQFNYPSSSSHTYIQWILPKEVPAHIQSLPYWGIYILIDLIHSVIHIPLNLEVFGIFSLFFFYFAFFSCRMSCFFIFITC